MVGKFDPYSGVNFYTAPAEEKLVRMGGGSFFLGCYGNLFEKALFKKSCFKIAIFIFLYVFT